MSIGMALTPLGTSVAEEIETITLAETVVTATRYEQNIESVPANVTVITQTDIQRSTALNLPDLLRTQTGLHVSDITGNRRSYTVDIRGFGETAALNTLVLVDGRRINAPDLSGTDWAIIPLDRVARIEIIRGGRSTVLYGDNASGGVINIITKEGDAFGAGAEASGGSFSTFAGTAYVRTLEEDVSFSLSASYLTSDGYRDNSDTDAQAFGANLGFYATDALRMRMSAGYNEDHTGLPGTLKTSDLSGGIRRTETIQPDDFADVEDYYFKWDLELFWMENSRLKLDASYRERESSSYATFSGGWFAGSTGIASVTVTPQLILGERLLGLTHTLTVGFDYTRHEEDISNRSLFFLVPSEGSFSLQKENYGYYVHEEMKPVDRLAVSAGYRYDRVELSFSPGETAIDEELMTAGIIYTHNGMVDAYVSFSRSFRYPVLDELFNFFTSTIDPALTPQSSNDFEAGIRCRFNDNIGGAINVFQLETEDEIIFNPVLFVNDNLEGNTRRKGIEAGIFGKFDRSSLSIGYAYTDSEILGGQFRGKTVPNVPEHMVTLAGRVDIGWGFSLALDGVYVGERGFVGDFGSEYDQQESYVLLNAKVSFERKPFSAFIDLNNVTGEDYAEYGAIGGWPVEQAYFPSPEFNVRLGIAINY